MGGVATSHSDGRDGAIPAATPFPASSHLLAPAKGFPKQCATVCFVLFREVNKRSSLGGAIP